MNHPTDEIEYSATSGKDPIHRTCFAWRQIPAAAWLILAVSAAIALIWSHCKLLSQDEIFVLQTDSVRSLGQLIDIQLHHPISLDPLAFHLLAHLGCTVFGAGAFAIRLPSLLGFLLFQFCLFEFLRTAQMARAGLIAMALPMATATSFYAAEGRPYGLLLGLLGLTMVCWQKAWRRQSRRQGDRHPRPTALTGLAISLALLLNTHYFAVLLLAPFFAAEIALLLWRRRLDPMRLLAMAIGCLGALAALPFSHAAGEFRTHYYNAGTVSFHAITMAYRALFVDFSHMQPQPARILLFSLILAAVLFAFLLGELLWKRELKLPPPEFVLLAALALLPLAGYGLARFVTHSIEVRYVVGAIAGIACLAAIVLIPLVETPGTHRALLPAGLVAILVLTGTLRIRDQQKLTAQTLAALTLPTQVRDAILASPSQRLYMQNLGQFEVARIYQPDAAIRDRLTLVWSAPLELEWDDHDTVSLTAEHLTHFSTLPIVRYEALRREPGDHVFLIFHSGWDWTDSVFSYPDVDALPLGPAGEGDAVDVRFLPREPGHTYDAALP